MKNYTFKIFSFFVLLLFCANTFHTQLKIELENSSIEGEPKAGQLPEGWLSRGTPGYSEPDTQPNATFGVSKPAKDGNTYIGMVTRADNSFEAITQRLKKPLKAGERYKFSCYLARSDSYLSGTLQNRYLEVQYNRAVKLRILGANALSGGYTVLDETSAIRHEEWKEYTFDLEPEKDYKYIILQAFWVTPYAYRGNILVDDCSPIKCVSCKPEPTPPPPPTDTLKVQHGNEPDTITIDSTDDAIEEPDTIAIDSTKSIPIEHNTTTIKHKIDSLSKIIHFEANLATLIGNSTQSLDEIYAILKNNPNLTIEVGGHTNLVISDDIPLSERRAKSVRDYLVDKGIDAGLITAKGYGRKYPIIDSDSKEANRINQRVEIVILKYE